MYKPEDANLKVSMLFFIESYLTSVQTSSDDPKSLSGAHCLPATKWTLHDLSSMLSG
jgi:hypothetical protein